MVNEHQEGLYLSKENGSELYVPDEFIAQLATHQMEGLRFLYQQYKKKRPGVILNDPTGYGKKTQVTIFLNTIRTIVTQPILILCNNIDVPKWEYHFSQWAYDCDDIVFELDKPFANKKIFVNTFDSISTFSQREWSVVVVDDPVSLKLFKPLKGLLGSFRIWIVSIDLKAHLNTFSAINEWVNPNCGFNKNMFVADKSNVKDVIEKAILLDCYFEDLVLRRGTSKVGESQPEPIFSPEAKVLRKNKDITGTKFKRSKKRILEDDDDESSSMCVKNKTKAKKNKRRIIDDDDDFGDENPFTNEVTNNREEMAEDNHVVMNDDDNLTIDDPNGPNCVETEKHESQELVLKFDFNDSSASASEEGFDTNLNQRDKKTECGTRVSIVKLNEDARLSKTRDDIEEHTNRTYALDETKIHASPKANCVEEQSLAKDNSDLNISNVTEIKVNEVSSNELGINKSKVSDNAEENVATVSTVKEEIMKTDKEDKSTSELNVSCNDTTRSSNETSFDDRLQELQESVNKKFKGSFLDNLF